MTKIRNLLKNITTQGLILFSIIIGVCSLLLLFSINEASEKEIVKNIKKGAGNHTIFLSQKVYTERSHDGELKKPAGFLSFNDLRVLKNSYREVKRISLESSKEIEYAKVEKREYPSSKFAFMSPEISGVTPEYKEMNGLNLMSGRFINNTDILYKRRVCVLGSAVYEGLGVKKIIGKSLITKNPDSKFTIVGVLHRKMPLFTFLPSNVCWNSLMAKENSDKTERKIGALLINDRIFIPHTTWIDLTKGIDTKMKELYGSLLTHLSLPLPTDIYIQINLPEGGKKKMIEDEENLMIFGEAKRSFLIDERLKESIDKMRRILRKRYGENKYFLFYDYGSLINEINDQIEESNKLLWITALFSLLLFGIILASIMLLSVHNRISEIGVRRAFGAKKKDIFFQFLKEGLNLYMKGIIIGLAVGLIVSYIFIVKIVAWEFSIPFYGIILSAIFPLLVGIISCTYPAYRASCISPAVAVKYE